MSNNTDEDFSDSSRYPQPGSRPVTTGGARPVTSRLRPVTSLPSRPGTALMPDWMFSEDQTGAGHVADRPKTGYIKVGALSVSVWLCLALSVSLHSLTPALCCRRGVALQWERERGP